MIKRHLLDLLTRQHGSVALEFGLIAPVLMLLLTAVLEFALLWFANSVLQTAATNGARMGKIGFSASTVAAEIDHLSAGLLNPANLSITETSYNSFASVNASGAGVSGTGAGGNIVVYTISYPWPIFTPGLQTILPNVVGGNFILSTTVVVENEPF